MASQNLAIAEKRMNGRKCNDNERIILPQYETHNTCTTKEQEKNI